MEELTQGIQPGSATSPGSSSSSMALAATPPRLSAPPRSSAPLPSSLLGPPPSGPSEGGGSWRSSSPWWGSPWWCHPGTGWWSGTGWATGGHHGLLFTTCGQGASLCGPTTLPVVSLVHQWPYSLALHLLASPLRLRGLHPPAPHLGLPAGTRRSWLARSAPWA
jgi:hypothetical protein